MIGAANTEGVTSEILTWLTVGAFALPALQITFFSFFDRDRLQNEEHVEKKLLIAQGKPIKGDASTMIVEGEGGEPVENPRLGGGSDV